MSVPCAGIGYSERDGVLAWLPPVGLATASTDVQITSTFPPLIVPFDTITVEGSLQWEGDPFYRFVIVDPGLYEMTLNLVWQDEGADPTGAATATPHGRRLARIHRNASVLASKQHDAVGIDFQSLRAGPVILDAGDHISAFCFQDSGSTLLLRHVGAMPSLGIVFCGEVDP